MRHLIDLAKVAPRLIPLVVVLGIIGCDQLVELQDEELPGRLSLSGFPAVVQAPDSVAVSVPFEVSVRTYGGGCISLGRTHVAYSPGVITIRPYDHHSGASVCNDDISFLEHKVNVTAGGPGMWRISVHGRGLPADTTVVIKRSVYAR